MKEDLILSDYPSKARVIGRDTKCPYDPLKLFASSGCKRIIACILFLFLISGCSIKPEIEQSKSQLVLLKTPQVRFYDTGFIKRHKEGVLLQIFNAAQVVFEIETDAEFVCVEGRCTGKDTFNEKFLSRHYPDKLFEQVVSGEDIFDGQNKIAESGTVTQTLFEPGRYAIAYVRTSTMTSFKDTINHITIRLKDLP